MDRTRIQRQITYTIICLLSIFLILIFTKKENQEDYSKYLVLEETIPHDIHSFTEGLLIDNGLLFESSGKYNQSFIQITNLKNNEIEKKTTIENDFFAEGITLFKDKIYLLTYKEKKLFVLNKETLEIEKELDYPKEGWGLTHDKDYLIASDGSNRIYFFDENLSLKKELRVKRLNEYISNINELEYIDGKIWANIWKTNQIIIINPKNGKVEKTLNFDELAKNHKMNNREEVMNGIAYDENNHKIYITGKNWESIYVYKKKS